MVETKAAAREAVLGSRGRWRRRALMAGWAAMNRQWMVRSFALACGAVTLRLYLSLLPAAGASFDEGYQAVAWISWMSNLLLAETLLSRGAVAVAVDARPGADARIGSAPAR